MRIVGAVLVLLLAAVPAAAQNDNFSSQSSVTGKQTTQTHKFRKSATRVSTLRARAAARRAVIAAQHSDTAQAGGEGTIRTAASAARKRLPAPPRAPRDTSSPVPAADLVAIQIELAWTGDFNGLVNGESNDKTTAAIKTFQRNRKFKETGVLNTQERALLAASAKAKQAQVGWSMVEDAVTGARLGLPAKQVPNKTQSKTGTRWSSAQGQVQVETFKVGEPGTTLAAVFEQQKKEPSTRKLEVNLLRGDFFILSGMQGLKKFYVRAEIRDGEVHGMTVLYDQATETIMDPVVVVMSSAFTPFPGIAAVAQSGPPPRRKVEYGTGIVVSAAGHILADRQVTDGCNVIVVSGYGDADRQAEDKTADLVLLRVYGVPDLAPAAFTGDAVKSPDVTLLGIADPQSQGGAGAISTVAAKLRGDTVEPAPQLGFSGAAVLDGQGRVAGMVALKTAVVANVGATSAQPQATVVPGQTIRAFLDGEKVPPATGRGGIDAAKASVVRVICVRK
jgi:peptidoglycan hydrolase-like protein with peptidoglycan-binding domain